MTIKRKMVLPVALALGVVGLMVVSQIASGSHVRPRGATPLRASLVPSYKACALPGNRTHGAPLSFASCNPPVQSSQYLWLGTPDANSAGAQSEGFIQLSVKTTSPEDVLIKYSTTDVRCRPGGPAAQCTSANVSDGPDFGGAGASVRGTALIRITDHYNGPNLNEAATVIDIPFPVDAPCSTTANTIGGTCAVTTSANGVTPGAVKDNQRGVIEINQLQIFDGGADGLASSPADNTLFEVQGIFIP